MSTPKDEADPPQIYIAPSGNWLTDGLMGFFGATVERLGELFLTVTGPLKTKFQDIGLEIYESGVKRLQPEKRIEVADVLRIAGDATADAIAENVILVMAAVIVQFIPTINPSAINQMLQLFADLSPDTEISRIVTRVMSRELVTEPIRQHFASKYRWRRMSKADAERAYQAGSLTKEGYAEILALEGYSDSDIISNLTVMDQRLAESLASVKPPDEAELKKAYMEGRITRTKTIEWLQVLRYEPAKIDILMGNWEADMVVEVTKPPPPPTPFETLVNQIERLDDYDAHLTRWLGDLDSRIKAGIGDVEKLKLERAEAWKMRETLLAWLSTLRMKFGAQVASEANRMLKEHADRLAKLTEQIKPKIKDVMPPTPKTLTRDSVADLKVKWSLAEKELGKVSAKTIPPRPTAIFKPVGTGIPRARDLERSLELSIAGKTWSPAPGPTALEIKGIDFRPLAEMLAKLIPPAVAPPPIVAPPPVPPVIPPVVPPAVPPPMIPPPKIPPPKVPPKYAPAAKVQEVKG